MSYRRKQEAYIATEDELIDAASDRRDGPGRLERLLAKGGSNYNITEAVLLAAAKNINSEVIQQLLEKRGSDVIITEAVLQAAAENSWNSKVMELLLDKGGSNIIITKAVLQAAAENSWGSKVMELLLDKGDSNIVITEAVWQAAVKNYRSKEVIQLLLDKGSSDIITEAVLQAAAEHSRDSKVMELLLDKSGSDMITEAVLQAAAKNYRSKEVIQLLLEKRGSNTMIAEVGGGHPGESSRGGSGVPLVVDPSGKTRDATITKKLYWRVLRLLRPGVKTGYRRLDWECDCGMPLYGDFTGEPEEINRLGRELRADGYVLSQSSTPMAQPALVSPGRQHSMSSSAIPPTSSVPQEALAPHVSQMTSLRPSSIVNPTPRLAEVDPSSVSTAGVVPRYLALCVNINKFKKTLSEIDISSDGRDISTFRTFKARYNECRGFRAQLYRSWLRIPVDIKFIRFTVERKQRIYGLDPPDCTICAHKEKLDDLIKSADYETPSDGLALVHPPIPPDAFFHLWDCPLDIPEAQAKWISRLPKKLHKRLEAVYREQPLGQNADVNGWGILIIEGLNRSVLCWVALVIVILSGAISVWYTIWAKDISGAFAVGAYVMAVLMAFITALYYQWDEG